MKNILHLNKTPLLNTYGFLADLLAVIEPADKDGIWLAANYNNIIGFKPDAPFSLYELSIVQNRECGLNMFYQCPFLDFYKYPRSEITADKLSAFIRENINHGYYVLVNIDRQYLSFYHIPYCSNHEVMVYGFDDEREEFLLCDNGTDGKYRTDIVCSYQEMREGYEKYIADNVKLDLHDSILLIKPTEDRYDYKFSVASFAAQIREYLNQTPTFCGRDLDGEWWIYGFENYQYFTSYVKEIIAGGGKDFRRDIRCFCALHDHKKSLLYTFQYFERKGLVDGGFAKRYSSVEEAALLVRNLMLKLYARYRDQTARTVLKYLEEMIEEEREILCDFLKRQETGLSIP